jgi:hypothetical protein
MSSYSSYSQSTIKVKKTTLIKIYKDLQICDSLQVAYNKQTKQLDTLISFNLHNTQEIQKERLERTIVLNKVAELNKQLNKKKKSTLPYILSGVGVGLITGILITK